MDQSKKITDGALLMAVYIILLLLTMYVPLFVLVGMFLIPIPFVVYASRYSYKATLVLVLLSFLLSIMFATVISLPLTLLASLTGTVIGTSIYKKNSSYEIWAKGALAYLVGFVLLFIVSQVVLIIDWQAEINRMVDESMEVSETLFKEAGLEEQATEQIELIREQMKLVTLMLPASLAVASIILAFLTQWMSYLIMNRVFQEKYRFPPFAAFNLPMSLFWLYFLTLFVSLFTTGEQTNFAIIISNAGIILGSLMVIQGLSFIVFYSKYKGLPKVLMVFMLIFALILLPIVRLLGVIDLGFQLKRRLSLKAEK